MIVQMRLKTEFLSATLLISNALANISFLILTSTLGLAEIIKREMMRKVTAYTIAIGIFSLIVSIALFL